MFNLSSTLTLINLFNLSKMSNAIAIFNLGKIFNLTKIFNFSETFNFRSRMCHYLEMTLCANRDRVSTPKIIFIIFKTRASCCALYEKA